MTRHAPLTAYGDGPLMRLSHIHRICRVQREIAGCQVGSLVSSCGVDRVGDNVTLPLERTHPLQATCKLLQCGIPIYSSKKV